MTHSGLSIPDRQIEPGAPRLLPKPALEEMAAPLSVPPVEVTKPAPMAALAKAKEPVRKPAKKMTKPAAAAPKVASPAPKVAAAAPKSRASSAETCELNHQTRECVSQGRRTRCPSS